MTTETTTTAADKSEGFTLAELRRWANAQAEHADDGRIRIVAGWRGQLQKITLTIEEN